MPELKHLNSLDYIVVGCYLIMLAGIGIYFARYNKNTRDFFKAGGVLPWTISALSLFVSGFSAFMFVAASGFTYRNGIASILVFGSAVGGYIFGYFIYGKLWRRSRIESPMEFLTRRFSQSTTYLYSIIAVLPNIFLMGALIYTLCIFISSALGFSNLEVSLGPFSFSGFELTLVSIGAVLLIYTVLGGLWAVAITDTLQFMILLLMTLVVFPLAFIHLGDGNFAQGFHNLWEQAPEGYLSFTSGAVPLVFIIAFWIQNILGYNVNWHVGQRYYSIPDERDTKKMALVAGVFSLVAATLWIMPVLVARVLFPDMGALWPELTEPTEASFVTLCLLILPHGFLGVVVSAMLAASMSSADTTFNWLSAVVTKDVFVPVASAVKGGEAPSERFQLWVGKSVVLIVGILAILISMSMQKYGSSFDIYLKIYSVASPPMFIPVLIGFLYRKTPWWSAMAASLTGIVATIAASVFANLNAGMPVNSIGTLFSDISLPVLGVELGRYEINIFVGSIVSFVVLLLSGFWSNKHPRDKKRLQRFIEDLQTPAHADPGAYDVAAVRSYQIVGLLGVAIGLLLVILSFVSSNQGGFGINMMTGIGAVSFGVFFWRMADRYIRRSKAGGREDGE